ncbi:MAG: hypothetical protein ACPHK8_06345 [Thermoplasmatota archaeon]
MKRVTMVILATLFAGCTAPAQLTTEPAVIEYDAGAETCQGVFFARLPEFSETDPWLPPGFTPADASTVLGETGYNLQTTNRAFMGAFGAECETYSFLNFWIAVDPPSLADDDFALHWYEVASFHENTPTTTGMHGANQSEMNATLQRSDVEHVFLAQDTQNIIELTAVGLVPLLSLDERLHFWQITPEGTLVLEGFVDVTANSGGSGCTSDYQWVLDFAANCNQDDFIAGTLPTMRYGGTYRFFENEFPV